MSNNSSRSNTLQIFRSAHSAYDALTDPTNLNYGELAWNNGAARLWIGRQTSTGTPGTITPYLLNPAASATVVGLVELATDTEANTGTDATRAVTPDNLGAWTGNTAITSVGTIGTGTWSGDALVAGKVPNLDDLTVGGNIDVDGNRVMNLPEPGHPNDAARKADVDAAIQGLDIRESVKYASTANVSNPTSNQSSAHTIDGTTVVAGDRVLLKNQTTGSQNGIYEVTYADPNWSMTRAADLNANADASANMFFFVEAGSSLADTGWVCTTDAPTLLNLVFAQFSGTGSYTATDGLDITGTAFGIADQGVTLARMANMATDSILGRDTAGAGAPEVLSASTARDVMGLGTSAVLDTEAIVDGGSGVATADQIDTFVKSFNYSTTVGDVTLTGTQTLTNKTIDCGTFIATS